MALAAENALHTPLGDETESEFLHLGVSDVKSNETSGAAGLFVNYFTFKYTLLQYFSQYK